MAAESLAKLLPKALFPYLHQWADSSGFTLLSKLLVDEQVQHLVEQYGDEIITLFSGFAFGHNQRHAASTVAGTSNNEFNDSDISGLQTLQERMLVLEKRQTELQAMFDMLRLKLQPLVLALGCCPDCLIGIEGCLNCDGRGGVGHFPPDRSLLEAQILGPLASRGVLVSLDSTIKQ
jgi:hypothetical protein